MINLVFLAIIIFLCYSAFKKKQKKAKYLVVVVSFTMVILNVISSITSQQDPLSKSNIRKLRMGAFKNIFSKFETKLQKDMEYFNSIIKSLKTAKEKSKLAQQQFLRPFKDLLIITLVEKNKIKEYYGEIESFWKHGKVSYICHRDFTSQYGYELLNEVFEKVNPNVSSIIFDYPINFPENPELEIKFAKLIYRTSTPSIFFRDGTMPLNSTILNYFKIYVAMPNFKDGDLVIVNKRTIKVL